MPSDILLFIATFLAGRQALKMLLIHPELCYRLAFLKVLYFKGIERLRVGYDRVYIENLSIRDLDEEMALFDKARGMTFFAATDFTPLKLIVDGKCTASKEGFSTFLRKT